MEVLSTGDILSILFFLTICFIIIIGYPIAFSLAGTSLVFAGRWLTPPFAPLRQSRGVPRRRGGRVFATRDFDAV